MVSKSTRSRDAPLMWSSSMADTATSVAPATMTEMATRMVPSGMVRP